MVSQFGLRYTADIPLVKLHEVSMSQTEDTIAVSFNQLYLKVEELYHGYAKRHGLSDSMLWLLYSLRSSSSAPP